jgi:hypothetical protein
MTDEMRLLLDAAGAHSRRIRVWLDVAASRRFEEACRQGFARLPLDDEPRKALQAKIMAHGGFVAYGLDCLAGLLRQVSVEREEIGAQMRQIASGLPAGGDLKQETKCYLAGLAFTISVGSIPAGSWGSSAGAIMAGVYLVDNCL